MKRNIRIKDKLTVNKHGMGIGGLRGEIIFGRGRVETPYTDPYGNSSYFTTFQEILYKGSNIVPIGGYQFAFNKLFNIGLDQESTLRVGDLNDEAPMMKIGIQRPEYHSDKYNGEIATNDPSLVTNVGINISAMNFIFGFMIGDGGAKEDNITAYAPDYKRRTLFRAIPFRMSNDGQSLIEGRYYGKSSTFSSGSGSITSYYIKKFSSPPPRIVHTWVTDNVNELMIVDDSVFASTSSMPIESYVEMNLTVSHEDGRGFFTSTNSSPRINEFGLVSGWYNPVKQDYEHIRLFTHFTRPSIALSDGDSVEAIYRLYAR